jgi:prepilin-type N-terminal cleavage/methylation domain-containing protein
MSRSCKSRSSARRGLSLIEVIAATVLAGTLLAATLIASRQHSRQAKAAQTKQAAVAALDQLLESWSTSDALKPNRNQGTVPGDSALRWSRRVLEAASDNRPFQVVRIAIHASGEEGPSLAYVDLMEPR